MLHNNLRYYAYVNIVLRVLFDDPLSCCDYIALVIYECFIKGQWFSRLTGKNRNSRRRLVPMSLCPPQISHGLGWVWKRFYTMRGRRVTEWTMVRPGENFKGSMHWNVLSFIKKETRFCRVEKCESETVKKKKIIVAKIQLVVWIVEKKGRILCWVWIKVKHGKGIYNVRNG